MRALLLAIMATTWSPGESGVAPEYTVPIHVVDSLMGTLPQGDRKEWRLGRNAALVDWGVPYYLTRLPESELAYPFDTNIGNVSFDGMLISDSVLIVRSYHPDVFTQGGYSDDMNAGIVILTPWQGWQGQGGSIRAELAHEYGHALGFWHGGNGVMGGAARVSDEERALALAYYT